MQRPTVWHHAINSSIYVLILISRAESQCKSDNHLFSSLNVGPLTGLRPIGEQFMSHVLYICSRGTPEPVFLFGIYSLHSLPYFSSDTPGWAIRSSDPFCEISPFAIIPPFPVLGETTSSHLDSDCVVVQVKIRYWWEKKILKERGLSVTVCHLLPPFWTFDWMTNTLILVWHTNSLQKHSWLTHVISSPHIFNLGLFERTFFSFFQTFYIIKWFTLIISWLALLDFLALKLSKNYLMLVIQCEGKCHLLNLHISSTDRSFIYSSARGEKVSQLEKVFKGYKKFSVIDIPDLSISNLGDAFEGMSEIRSQRFTLFMWVDIEVLIHVAAFLPSFRGDIEVVKRVNSRRLSPVRILIHLKFSTEGTERILDSAREAGVKTIIVTGSQVTYNIDGPIGPRGW